LALVSLLLSSLACQTLLGRPDEPDPVPDREPTEVSGHEDPIPTDDRDPDLDPTPGDDTTTDSVLIGGPDYSFNEDGVRYCLYRPGDPVAQMPDSVTNAPNPTPYPLPPAPVNTPADSAVIEEQLDVFDALWQDVVDNYVYTDYNGVDIDALREEYRTLIQAGLSQEDFYSAMKLFISRLGDNHSNFETPEEVAESDASLSGNNDYVGIGVMLTVISDDEPRRAVITMVFDNSPAQRAGLRSHDAILSVDGLEVVDSEGTLLSERVRGPEGSTATFVIQRPGQDPVEVDITRARISGSATIDYCLVEGTGIGYIYLPSFSDETFPTQIENALEAMAESGPIEGLIIDNRQNGGGSSSVAHPIMEFFVDGNQGAFISRSSREELDLRGEDIVGSQSIPLAVLVDVDTVSYGEIFSGVMKVAGRAVIVGRTTLGNVERMWGFNYNDGSRAWIATETFEPIGETAGIWEESGIIPDIDVPTRWDLFTEADDPALAAAVGALLNR
jgi:C-terminal peptidase prc